MPVGDLEHLIMDGLSNDSTVQMAESVMDGRSRLYSEADNGMYDAINKGLQIASGEIIGILNADDAYASPDVLLRIVQTMEESRVDSAYGDLEYVQQDNPRKVVRYWKSGSFRRSQFRWGWMPPHPSFFVRKAIYDEYGGFRTDMKIAADYEIMSRFLYQRSVSSCYVPSRLVRMRLGGLSNTPANLMQKSREDMRACRLNGLRPAAWVVACKMVRKLPQYLKRLT